MTTTAITTPTAKGQIKKKAAPVTREARDTIRTSWAVSTDKLRSNLSHNNEESIELLVWCYFHCLEHQISRAEFARKVGTTDSTIFKIIGGTYFAPSAEGEARVRQPISEKLYNSMLRFKQLERERVLSGPTEFIETSVAKKIHQACLLALESNTPVILTGASHIGKTTALEHYAANDNTGQSKYIRITSASSGIKSLLDTLCETFGINTKIPYRFKLPRLKKAITDNNLILFDEAHLLTYAYTDKAAANCFEILRELFDSTRCGMVFSFTNVGMERVNDDIGNIIEQLFRRSVHRFQLGNFILMQDVKTICAHAGLSWPTKSFEIDFGELSNKPLETLKMLAQTSGLKSITERLRYAKKLASKAGQALEWEHFSKAHLIIESNNTSPVDDWA